MINAAETIPPLHYYNGIINAAETIPPGRVQQINQSLDIRPGESIADSYIVSSLMDKQGKQSDVYLARKWGKTYAIKIYQNGWRPSVKIQNYLTNVHHPNIARIIEYGEYKGNYYEVYDYYSEGTLQETKALPITHIQNVIIPSINEGLHELHRNGIVHCDIKPSNLFYSEDRDRVIIGDCGISGYTNANGKFVDAVRGTPEYAPRVKALLWNAVMSPAYDYGSFGLVLCKTILGHSLFEGMSVDEISRSWENGIELPSQINGRMAILIKGLINENEEDRWGYEQVKRWCEGEFIRPVNRNIYDGRNRGQKKIRPMIFGMFSGQTIVVSSLHQLALAIRDNWNQAKRIVRRRELPEFVRQFRPELTDNVRDILRIQDDDTAVFRLLTLIDDDYDGLFFGGKEYKSLNEYVECLATGNDDIAKKCLKTGSLLYYLRANDYDSIQVDRLEQLIRRNRSDDMAAITTICFALQGRKTFTIKGTDVENLEDLVSLMPRLSLNEIKALLDNERFIAWMNRLGYEKEMKRMKEVI